MTQSRSDGVRRWVGPMRRIRRAGSVAVVLIASLVVRMARADAVVCARASEAAQELRLARKLLDARGRALECMQPSCPEAIQRDCQEWLSGIERDLPSVVLAAKDETDADLARVTVTEHGQALATTLSGGALNLDPGEHVLRFARFDRPEVVVEERLILAVGQHARLVTVRLPLPTKLWRAPRPALPAPPTVWLLAGSSALALAATIVFGVKAERENAQSRSACGYGSCTDGERSTLRRDAIVVDVAAGTTLLTASLAAYFYFTRSPPVVFPRARRGSGAQPLLFPQSFGMPLVSF